VVALGPGSVLGRSGSRGGSWSCRRQRCDRRTLLSTVYLLRAVSLPAVPGRVEWLRLGTQLLLRRGQPIALECYRATGPTITGRLNSVVLCFQTRALLGIAARIAFACALWLIACGTPARSEPDAFMRSVGFALTGSDDAVPKVIGDRTNCVFAINNEIFHLNNVHADRITIQGWNRQRPWGLEQWVTVALPGDDVVFEETIEPAKDDGSELMRHMRELSPELFKSQHYTLTEHELHLTTNDQDRVKRAWQYIYSHGCTGK
jgi:hypothetical protein